MASIFRKITNVSCPSLSSLGFIYNLNYDYQPQQGIRITLYFVNSLGKYSFPVMNAMVKTAIIIGSMSFSMNMVKFTETIDNGQRVMMGEFVDDTFQLENFLVVLTGMGCGINVYQLGTSVDPRSQTDINSQSIDLYTQSLKNVTQFIDIEYGFVDFLNILKQQFVVEVLASYDASLRRGFTGTFKEVLTNWCQFYNLTWYFENGNLKIIDPTKININFTELAPSDAIQYEYSQSIEDTYDKTVFATYNQEGGLYGSNGLIQTANLYANGANNQLNNSILSDLAQSQNAVLGDLSDSPAPSASSVQITLDLTQVAAAMYGQQFWFLYNYYNGTADIECGWTPIVSSSLPTTLTIAQAINSNPLANSSNFFAATNAAYLNEDIFNQKYQAYSEYGAKIAGRYYLSDYRGAIDFDRSCNWYNVTDGQIFDFTSDQAEQAKLKMQFLVATNDSTQVIENTAINQYFDGIKYIGNRMLYIDQNFPNISNSFQLSNEVSTEVNQIFLQIFGVEGSNSTDFSELGTQKYILYQDIPITQTISNLVNNLPGAVQLLQPTYAQMNIVGISTNEVKSQFNLQQTPTVQIIAANGPTAATTTSTINVLNAFDHQIYYSKFSKCISASSNIGGFRRIFNSKILSNDIPTPTDISTNTNNYKINQSLAYINQAQDQTLLNYLAQPRTFPTITVMFGTNYFYNVPFDYLSNGLTNLQISMSDNGVAARYTFSNIMLTNTYSEAFLDRLELNMKNSWIRQFNPTSTNIS